MDLSVLEPEKWLELNARLQQKKNSVRKELNKKGVLKKQGHNEYDHYSYFSEAQYKRLFTELFSKFGLELKFDEIAYDTFEGTGKQANGRFIKLVFSLIDISTGFYEESSITSEGLDKGDKAGYKAYTGAVKYYLATTFLVATGDDAEAESPDKPMGRKRAGTITPKQLQVIEHHYTGESLTSLLSYFKVKSLNELSMKEASSIIATMKHRASNDTSEEGAKDAKA